MVRTILPEPCPRRSTVRDLLVWLWLTGSIPVLQHFQRHMTDWLAGGSQFQVLETHPLRGCGLGSRWEPSISLFLTFSSGPG